MRLFIGISLPDEVKEKLIAIQDGLPLREAVARITQPEQLHLTVKFLGETSAELLPGLESALSKACEGTNPFTLSLNLLGTFPDRGQVRIIWAGAKENIAPLRKVHTRTDEALLPLGFAREARDYFPHITIARVKEDHGRKLREKIEAMQIEEVALAVDKIRIFQSIPLSDGSRYESVHTIIL